MSFVYSQFCSNCYLLERIVNAKKSFCFKRQETLSKNISAFFSWAYLEIDSSPQYADHLQAYSAGVVEAQATEELIRMHLHNTYYWDCVHPTTEDMKMFCNRLEGFLEVYKKAKTSVFITIADQLALHAQSHSALRRPQCLLASGRDDVVSVERSRRRLSSTTFWTCD